MNGEPDLVGLLYRADWTRLALSAEVSDGSSVLVAPGKRYRHQTAGYLTGCGGGRPWELITGDGDPGGRVHWVSGPEPPLAMLLCPAWLLVHSRVRVRGRARACGREAIDAVITGWPGIRGTTVPGHDLPRRVEVLVDAELGILLRVAEVGSGGEPKVTELASADFSPVIDPERFTPPPGSRIAEGIGEALAAGGPAWWAVKTAGGLAAGGLGLWIRHSQPTPTGTADTGAAMPGDDSPPQLSPDGRLTGPPVRDDLLALLHSSGRSGFTAALHEWADPTAMASQVPPAARRAGFGGLGLLMDAVSERPAAIHHTSTVQIAGPGRYQIDYTSQRHPGPETVACDGHQRWQVYSDKVTTGPPQPPPPDIGRLADPSWLLQQWLTGGEQVTASGRPAYRISVARGRPGPEPMLFPAATAVIDAELGIALRLTYYIGGKPVCHYELHDVTTGSEFQVDIPAGLPVTEETGPYGEDPRARPPHPVSILPGIGDIATHAARHAAAHAAKTARNLLNRMDHRPHGPT